MSNTVNIDLASMNRAVLYTYGVADFRIKAIVGEYGFLKKIITSSNSFDELEAKLNDNLVEIRVIYLDYEKTYRRVSRTFQETVSAILALDLDDISTLAITFHFDPLERTTSVYIMVLSSLQSVIK